MRWASVWLKLLLCVFIVAFCTFLGYLSAGKYRARKRFYVDMYAFHERYLNELSYARRPLSKLLQIEKEGGDFFRFLRGHAQKGKRDEFPSYLSEEEKKDFEEYLNMLGVGDSFSQKGYFGAKSKSLSESKDAAVKEEKERGELYLKLGLLAGLAFVILIV